MLGRRREQRREPEDGPSHEWATVLRMVKMLEEQGVNHMHEFGEMMALAAAEDPATAARQMGISGEAAAIASRDPTPAEADAARVAGLAGGFVADALDSKAGSEFMLYVALLIARFPPFLAARRPS